MTLALHVSNRLEPLLDALADALRSSDPLAALEAPAAIVAPSAWSAALRVGLATRLPALAGPTFHASLAGLLADAARGAGRALLDEDARLGLLLRLLDPRALPDDDPEVAPLRGYLLGPQDDPPGAADLRRVQLAERLAGDFERLAAWRPDVLAAWRRGEAVATRDASSSEVEAWQRHAWRRLQALTPAGALDLREAGAALDGLSLPRAIHAFVAPWSSPRERELLRALGERTRVHIHALALGPVPEAREDGALAGAPSDASPSPSSLGEDEAAGHPLGRSGALGREQLRAWRLAAREAAAEVHARWVDPGAGTALRRLQRSLAGRSGSPPAAGWPSPAPRDEALDLEDPASPPEVAASQTRRLPSGDGQPAAAIPTPGVSPGAPAEAGDRSLELLACADRRRELETVAERIWELLEEDRLRAPPGAPPLRVHDVALVLPSDPAAAARYRALLPGVFQGCHDLRWTALDGGRGASPVLEALTLLLALPEGRFARSDVLRLLVHPALAGGLPEGTDPGRVARWFEALAVVEGADDADQAGSYLAGSHAFHWEQALRRLTLGAFMAGERGGDDGPVEVGGVEALPFELPHEQRPVVAAVVDLVRDLLATARACRAGARGLAEWAELLQGWARRVVRPRDDDARQALERAQGALGTLAALEPGAELRVRYPVAVALARRALLRLGGGRAPLVAEGVAVAPLDAARPLPYRVVVAVGLDEGTLPAVPEHDPLDLVAATGPRPGDVDPERRDRHAFLALLLAPTDRLLLSWVGFDALTGASRPPAVVVQELQDHLEEAGLLDAARARPPLGRRWRDDPRAFPAPLGDASRPTGDAPVRPFAPPAAWEEARLRRLRADLAATGAAPRTWPALAAALAEPARERVRALLQLEPAPAPEDATSARPGRAPLRLSLWALVKFLRSPLQGWAQHRLFLARDDEGALAVPQEPFEPPVWEGGTLLREAFVAARGGEGLAAAHARLRRRQELLGRFPFGPFGEAAARAQRETLDAWEGATPPGALVRRGLGLADDLDGGAPTHAALRAPLGPDQSIEVWGQTLPTLGDAGPLVVPLSAALSRAEHADERHVAEAFVHLAALRAAGAGTGPATALLVDRKGGARRVTFRGLVDARAGLAALGALAADLLGGDHAYLLPVEAVGRWWRAEPERPERLPAHVMALRREGEAGSDAFGPLGGLERFAPPGADLARAAVSGRLAPFLERDPGEGDA